MIMEKILAACGLDCAVCPAFIASKTDDNELRKKTAAEWGKAYNFAFTPEMVNCHGCFATDGVQIGHCAQCGIRACAVQKSLSHCGDCKEYACDQLSEFFTQAPFAKDNLEAVRKTR
jgi:hypothetical protein